MVSNGHFRTIVGIKGDEVLLKDSIPFRTHGANHTYRVSIKEILKESTKLFWLHDLKMEKDGSCAEFSGNTELTYKDGAIEFQDMKAFKNSKGVIKKRQYNREMAKEYRGLMAEEGGGDSWTKDARAFRVETRKYKSEEGKIGSYNMFLPHKIYAGEPRKIRRYTEAEIELIDRLNGREVLEDIQMILSTPDKNGLYPAMTEKNLEDLNTAYEKVSKLYGDILNDKKVSLSQKQRNHLQVLKGRVDREKQIFSTLKKNESGVLPTYRDALRQGMRALETGAKNPYEAKAQALQSLQEKFAELEKQGHKNSKEYTEMVKAAKNLQLVAMAITDPKNWEKLGIEQVPNEDQVDSIVKRAEDIAVKAVEKYVNEKGNPYTEFGKKRLAVAKDLQEELSNSITIFREERTDELMKEVARQKAKILESKPKELEKKQDDTQIICI
jgi:hypothetical protein